jgi:hypothetical protein
MHSLAPGGQSGAPHRSLVLAPYVERFARGRRVAVFGDVSTGLPGAIAARGARLVHAYDPDGARIAQALALAPPRNLQLAHLASGDLGVRDGAFDVVVVPDLAMFRDVKGLLAQVRQATAAGGVVVIATAASPGAGETGLGYYDFYDAISLQFAEVKMAGQVPFAGWALVDFAAEGEPDVSVDTSLVTPGEPTLYVAVASDRPVAIDGYSIVQLDAEPAAAASPDESDAFRAQLAEALAGRDAARVEAETLREARRAAETRIAEEQRRVTELTQALAEAESIPRRLEARLAEETRRAGHLATQLARLQEQPTTDRPETMRALNEARAESARAASREQDAGRKLDAAERRAQDAEKRAAEAERRATETERKVEGDGRRTAELDRKIGDADRKVADADRKAADAERKLTEADRKATDAERKLTEADRKAADAERKLTEGDRKAADAERRAAESAKKLDELQRRVDEASRKLDEATKKLAAAIATPRADPAELDGARARITELEARLARVGSTPTATEQAADVSALESTLQGRAHEIAELRREVERRGSMVRELLESLEASRAVAAPLRG